MATRKTTTPKAAPAKKKRKRGKYDGFPREIREKLLQRDRDLRKKDRKAFAPLFALAMMRLSEGVKHRDWLAEIGMDWPAFKDKLDAHKPFREEYDRVWEASKALDAVQSWEDLRDEAHRPYTETATPKGGVVRLEGRNTAALVRFFDQFHPKPNAPQKTELSGALDLNAVLADAVRASSSAAPAEPSP